MGNPLFLKEFIFSIGYLLESDLRKSLNPSNEKDNNLPPASEKNFKSLLTKLSSQLHQIIDNPTDKDLNPDIRKLLTNISEYYDESLKTIYNQQVANVIEQEEDHSYYFQIPFKSTDELKIADLFIKLDDENGGIKRKNDQCQFVLFLNMDALGDIMVDVKYLQRKILGVFKCVDSESLDFLSDYLDTLNERLILSGYGPNDFNVCLSDDLHKEKSDFIKDKVIYSKKIINCFA